MAITAEYQIAAAAVFKVVQADIEKNVPVMFRGEIPQDIVKQFAADAAKAAIDAVDADRAKQDAAKGMD
jgi:hypothetical protein